MNLQYYLALLGSASLCAPFAAIAQTAPDTRAQVTEPGYGSIVVTAQRREQNLQTVPASITAVSSDTLAQSNVVSVNQLNAIVPSFQVAQPFGAGGPGAYTIRGISSTDFNHNQSRPVVLYVDDSIRQLPTLEFTPLFDVQRIEVLRGPQGALYGKNATGGAVNIITRKPGFDTEGYLTAGYGNFNRFETQGAAQGAVVNDLLAVRLAYTYISDDGVIRNVHPGIGNLDQTKVFGIRGSILLKPGSDFEALLRVNHYSSTGAPAASLPVNMNFTAFGLTNIADAPGVDRSGLSYFDNDQEQRGHQKLISTGANLQLSWSVSDDIDIISITSYDEGKWTRLLDGDGLPVTLTPFPEDAHGVRQFVEELRVSGSSGPLTWLIGGFLSHDRIQVNLDYEWMADPVCGWQCDFGIGGGGIGISFGNNFVQKRKSHAIFARAEYELSPTVSLALGGRYSRDTITVSDLVAYFGDSVTQFPTIGDPVSGNGIRLHRKFQKFSGEVILNWQPDDDINAYASFKQGYRSGAFNAYAFDIGDAAIVPPETANNFEVGLKTQFLDRRVTFNIAGFLTRYKNQQVISSESGTFPLRSIPKARIWGIEADTRLQLLDSLSLNASISHTSPEYQQGAVSGVDISGNQITNAAKWIIQGGFDWDIADIGHGLFKLHGDAAYQSRTYFDTLNTHSISDSGHVVVNGQLAYTTSHYDVELWVTNLFNEKYRTYGVDMQEYGFDYVNRGIPRQYGVRLRYRF